MVKMSEIKINVPKGIPLSPLKRKIDRLVKEEEIKWTLFEKCKDELLLDKNDLEELENIREKAWKETKKKYAL
jgi:hypothetical protein